MKNQRMEKIYEQRRQDLLQLVSSMGRGSIARIAGIIGVEPNYVSRLLYPEGKRGKKNIGDELVVKLDKFYPTWRKQPAKPATDAPANEQMTAYLIEEISTIAAQLPADDQQKLLGLAIHLKKERGPMC